MHLDLELIIDVLSVTCSVIKQELLGYAISELCEDYV